LNYCIENPLEILLPGSRYIIPVFRKSNLYSIFSNQSHVATLCALGVSGVSFEPSL
jgi:hypothetical protein